MIIDQEKKLVLHGLFAERKKDNDNPYIDNTYFNIYALKKCIEEIRCVI